MGISTAKCSRSIATQPGWVVMAGGGVECVFVRLLTSVGPLLTLGCVWCDNTEGAGGVLH